MEMAINRSSQIVNQEFYVKDIGEASAIVANGITLLRLEKDPSGFYWFVFPSGKSNDISSLYWNDELTVLALRFNECLKALKDRIYSQKRFNQ